MAWFLYDGDLSHERVNDHIFAERGFLHFAWLEVCRTRASINFCVEELFFDCGN